MARIVLTGGPCSGKTTVARRLRELGFVVVPEAAETIIRSGKRPEGALEFQWEIFKLQLKLEEEHDGRNHILFLDRGIPDGIAYTRFWGYDPPGEFIKTARNRYDRVLFFERLPFRDEGFRVERSEEEANRAHRLIMEAYRELGYHLDIIPVAPIEERVRMVLRKVGIYPRI